MTIILENSAGPGSSVTLDPEIITNRNKYLKALDGKPFDEMNLLIQKQLEKESNDMNRLSLLAARVYILRVRTLELKGESTEEAMPWSEKKKEDGSNKDDTGKQNQEKAGEGSDWRRLRMTDAGEVNGVRFPPGIIIDVNLTDADKLIKSGKAEFVEVDDKKAEVKEEKAEEAEASEEKAEEVEASEEKAEQAEAPEKKA
mgnify:FL=1